ncbi:hypothetical protein [Tautonia plasticadhaerens]|uniref:Uncharacterized protein n=1 Tax=Tautonia plasticadhaerens TaxID=2527974 RepID=A0A518GZG4_9BACT|nr:hypothetical protein [Tautonia plasticadhaerens]QDV33963.1 hypothetical protein ElP_18440 [Tautonia plasticadhaerens]
MRTRDEASTLHLPLAPAILAVLLAGCGGEPTRWDEAQAESRRAGPAVAEEATAGSELNEFFPEDEGTLDVVFTQEKPGFSQADLVDDGETVATLSIFDTTSNPEAAGKFADSDEELDGHPMAQSGSMGTALLVGDRYQVQVRSVDADFDRARREEWLRKFDLADLAAKP